MTESQDHRLSVRRSREEATGLVLEYEQSGLTRREFCRRHDLSLATLDYYRKRIASANPVVSGEAACSSEIPFVAVELTEQPAVVNQEVRQGARLFVELVGGRCIGVGDGFDALTLRRLIAVLEQE